MKFYCDSCTAKYLIGDEKVKGKVLRIRCKRCGHVMTVRGPTLPVQEPEPVQEQESPQSKGVEWFYSRSGETFGPYELSGLQELFATSQLGDEAYVWNATFTEWVPAKERPEFEEYFKRGQVRRPRRPTMNLNAADLKSAVVAAQEAKESSSSASPSGGGSGRYRRLDRPRTWRSSSDSAVSSGGGADSGLSSPQQKPASSPSHILKRATAAHNRSTGSAIFKKGSGDTNPGALAPTSPSKPSGPSSGPTTDRLRSLREKLQSQRKGGSPSSLSRGRQSGSGPGARRSASPSSSSQRLAVPSTGQSLKERLAERARARTLERESRDSREVPELEALAESAPEPVAEPAPSPAAPAAAAPEPADDEIPELSLDDLEFEDDEDDQTEVGLDFAEIESQLAARAGARAPELEALAGSAAEPAADPEPAPAFEATPTPTPIPEPEPEPAPVAPIASNQLMPLPSGSNPDAEDDGPPSHSLLIQLEDIQRNKKKTRRMALIGATAALFLVAVGVASWFVFFSGPSERQKKLTEQAREGRERAAEKEVAQADVSKRKGYSENQLADMNNVIELGVDDGLADDKEVAADEEGDEGAEGDEGVEDSAGGGEEVAEVDKGAEDDKAPGARRRRAGGKKAGGGLDLAKGLIGDKKDNSLDGALASASQVDGEEGGLKRKADGGTGEVAKVGKQDDPNLKVNSGSVFRDLASSGRKRVDVKRVERERNPDEDAAPAKLPSTLNRKDLVKGFRNVRRSADQCLERHLKRAGRLPKGKVRVVVTIEGNGKVSAVNMDREINNTIFESCMQSHQGRWRFPQFGGSSLNVARVFLLQ